MIIEFVSGEQIFLQLAAPYTACTSYWVGEIIDEHEDATMKIGSQHQRGQRLGREKWPMPVENESKNNTTHPKLFVQVWSTNTVFGPVSENTATQQGMTLFRLDNSAPITSEDRMATGMIEWDDSYNRNCATSPASRSGL